MAFSPIVEQRFLGFVFYRRWQDLGDPVAIVDLLPSLLCIVWPCVPVP